MHKMEQFWDNLRAKTKDARTWNDLPRNEQDALIHAINLVIAVCNNAQVEVKDAD